MEREDSPVEGEMEIGRDDREETEQSLRYPGLDKRHGFFISIANNQSARDSYHWKKEEEKWKRKQEIDDQVRENFGLSSNKNECLLAMGLAVYLVKLTV